jgi:hemoglobin-like flavoprotein
VDIHESVHRILQNKECFADLFYVVFLQDEPAIQQHFHKVNLRHQAVLLTMALLVMERHFAYLYPATEMYLNYLGTKHHSRGIPAELYPRFRDALLATLERFHGKDWNSHLATQWRQAIDHASESMLKGYRQSFHV